MDNTTTNTNTTTDTDGSSDSIGGSSSSSSMDERPIETLLSVPLHYILRQTNSSNSNSPSLSSSSTSVFLLSRIEASLLLQITTLSYELDTLIQMSIEAIEKSYKCQQFSHDISTYANANNVHVSSMNRHSVYLRPLHCLLHQHGIVIPQQVIQHVQDHLERILGNVPSLVKQLKQCAEQNWSVSHALLQMNMNVNANIDGSSDGNGNSGGSGIGSLGKEKGLIAAVEEEVGRRLEGIVNICTNVLTMNGIGNGVGNGISSKSELNQRNDDDVMNAIPMEEFCDNLFGTIRAIEEDTSANANANANTDLHDGTTNTREEKESYLHAQSMPRTESINAAAAALGMLASTPPTPSTSTSISKTSTSEGMEIAMNADEGAISNTNVSKEIEENKRKREHGDTYHEEDHNSDRDQEEQIIV